MSKKGSAPESIVPYQFKPGESGNPAGRPKKTREIPELLEKLCKEQTPSGLKQAICETFELPPGEPMPMMEAVLRGVLMRAARGEAWAVQFIAERLEGKALQRVIAEVDSESLVPLQAAMEAYSDVAAKLIADRQPPTNVKAKRNGSNGVKRAKRNSKNGKNGK